MIHKTKGIVLRTVKYGESSLIVTAFTELFGIQTYMVKAARTPGKKGNAAARYQPASILDLEVYNLPQKNLQYIRESSRSYLYQSVQSDVIKNSIALFVVELLYKLLKQPEKNETLFYFCEDLLCFLDGASMQQAANLPLFFCLQLPQFFGFKMQDPPIGKTWETVYLDLADGCFTEDLPQHQQWLSTELSQITMELLRVQHPSELEQIQLSQLQRRNLLKAYLDYYAIHVPDFTPLKSIAVLQTVIG